MYRYFLSVISIFKNEAHILEEWLEHYLKEGVEHFYLLNNNSTDNFKDILNKYSQFVELYDARENYTQVKHLNSQLDEIKTNSEWILYSDLDEFVFTKQNYKTLPDTIKLLDYKIDNLGQIRIPWIIFSSNGFIEQPSFVIPSFVDRKDYSNNPGKQSKNNCKYIAKTKLIIDLNVHHVNTKGKTILSNGDVYKKNKFFITDNVLEDHLLQCNHYVNQSRKWFLNVKATRGSVSKKEHINLRDLEYFNKYDQFTGYTDTLLKNKIY